MSSLRCKGHLHHGMKYRRTASTLDGGSFPTLLRNDSGDVLGSTLTRTDVRTMEVLYDEGEVDGRMTGYDKRLKCTACGGCHHNSSKLVVWMFFLDFSAPVLV